VTGLGYLHRHSIVHRDIDCQSFIFFNFLIFIDRVGILASALDRAPRYRLSKFYLF